MARDDDTPRDPERKRDARSGAKARANARAAKRGRSGYGIDSIRPHLLEQIEQRKLLRPTFPPETPEDED